MAAASASISDISTSPYATPALKDLWMEIRRSYEETGVGRAAGRAIRVLVQEGGDLLRAQPLVGHEPVPAAPDGGGERVLWMEIRRSYEETGVGRAAGREWRGAMAKGTEVGAIQDGGLPRLQAFEEAVPHLAEPPPIRVLVQEGGRGRDRLMTDEWLSAKKVAALLNQNPDRGRFREVHAPERVDLRDVQARDGLAAQ
jgi:hypothetical protein